MLIDLELHLPPGYLTWKAQQSSVLPVWALQAWDKKERRSGQDGKTASQKK